MKPIRIVNFAKYLTVEDCLELCATGFDVAFEDGRDFLIDSDLA